MKIEAAWVLLMENSAANLALRFSHSLYVLEDRVLFRFLAVNLMTE